MAKKTISRQATDRPKTASARRAPRVRPSPGRLEPMRVSPGFRAFVLDQLSEVEGLRDRAMFGGIGLYAGDVFFGIIAADTLYFKVDESTRAAYESAGSRPFKPYADRAMTMPYYAVPAAILDHPATAVLWAVAAVRVAQAAKGSSRPAKAATRRRA